MSASTRIHHVIGRVATAVGALALLALGGLMAGGVVTRFAGGVITGATEISEMLVIVMASMSLLAATVYGAHPHVHVLLDRMRTHTKRRVAMLVAALSCGFWATASFVTGRVALENWLLGEETELLRLSVIPFRLVLTVALALIAVVLAIKAFQPDTIETDAGH